MGFPWFIAINNNTSFYHQVTELIQSFWTNLYVNLFGDIHANPTTEEHLDNNKSAMSTW